jgi:hypothetical protein
MGTVSLFAGMAQQTNCILPKQVSVLGINQAKESRRVGADNRNSNLIGAGRPGNGALIVRVRAHSVSEIIRLRQQTPAGVIEGPGQIEICSAHLR